VIVVDRQLPLPLNAALWTANTVAEGGMGDLFCAMNRGSSTMGCASSAP